MNSKICCLLLEDDPEDQQIFLEALHSVSEDTVCYAVSNGEQALHLLIQEEITPDYIFTDLNMPRMGGGEFLKKLKDIEKLRNIPVIVYSSDHSEDQMQNIKALGAIAVYPKSRLGILKDILKKYFPAPSGTTIL